MSVVEIVVLRALGLGDLLTGIPALRGLRAACPGARITLAAPTALRPIAGLSGAVDKIVDTAPLRPLAPGLHGADLAVDLHGRGPQSTRLLLDAAPRRLIGFACDELPVTRGLPEWRVDEHEVARWCRLLRECGIPADPSRLELPPPAEPPTVRDAVLVHPGAAPARRWPAARWAAVIGKLAGGKSPILITGSAAERELARQIAARAGLPARYVLAGRTGLGQLAALTASACLVLSGDTGMAHLAAAYARPAVTLAGPVAPRLWGPPPRPWHAVLWTGHHGDPHGDVPDQGLLEIGAGDVVAAAHAVQPALASGARPAVPPAVPPKARPEAQPT